MTVTDEKKIDTEYLFYKVEYKNCSLHYDYTICKTLNDVRDALQCVDTDLDYEKANAAVIITGIGMTNKQYSEWCEKNNCDE